MFKLKTYGELLGPAMKIMEQEEADKYFEYLIGYYMVAAGYTREKAIEVAKINLGYYAGYYSKETYDRVMKLFCTEHPIFGKTWPTLEDAFEAGKKAAGGL